MPGPRARAARWGLGLWLLLAACGREEAPPAVKPPAARKFVVPKPPPPSFDPHGNLLAAELMVGWLEVPRGFVELRRVGELRIFRGEKVPLDRLQAFYGARVLPHATEKLARGVHFLAAAPLDGREVQRMNIAMEQADASSDSILRIEPVVAVSRSKQLTPSEAKSALLQDEKRAE